MRTIKEKTEIRDLITDSIEIREDEDGNRTISGYAVKWEKKSHVLGYFYKFREQFKKGAFADSLEKDDQRFLWSHDVSKVLGRRKNNTLRLEEDEVGLRFELDLPKTSLGDDTYESIKRGDVDGVTTYHFALSKKPSCWRCQLLHFLLIQIVKCQQEVTTS